MASIPPIGAGLLSSRDFSDLTLECGSRVFHVHKCIEVNTYKLEALFGPTHLKYMLDYMYTADYQTEPPISPARPSESIELTSTHRNKKQKNTVESASTTVLFTLPDHAQVNNIAVYYGVTGLAKLSATKIEDILNRNWSADLLSSLVREISGKDCLYLFASTIAVKNYLFSEENLANDPAAGALQSHIGVFKFEDALIRESEDSIHAKAKKIAALEQNLKELANTLLTTRACRTGDCRRTFGCVIEPPSPDTGHGWVLQCSSCGSRQDGSTQGTPAMITPPPPYPS
ncbi:hypothetical protein NUW58_g4617 [Xylaria curta]|uniref:Uncharacterized protein n=1 Tax=Xylaria curta TaxID=42375 RepID=A0ACC1P630_9PEZI|nr:hypothetical protein NUW58_g4617 [Xylaria curta]